MAADDLSTANLPPLAWTTDTISRESRQDSAIKEKKPRKFQPKAGESKAPAEIDFEQIEHELDSIA